MASPVSMGGAGEVAEPRFPTVGLVERLAFGELPGIVTAPEELRGDLLRSYCSVYLEEELRREALIKDWAAFSRFLQLAATESEQRLTPIEVKWTDHPTPADARHLLQFMREHPERARHGYVVCRCASPLRLHEQITALPWFCL